LGSHGSKGNSSIPTFDGSFFYLDMRKTNNKLDLLGVCAKKLINVKERKMSNLPLNYTFSG
jgi:hypothetical protein